MPENAFDGIARLQVPPGRVGITWLGQAGFLLKGPNGKIIAIDPYLSNRCEEVFGFKRLSPAVTDLEGFAPDLIICSHEHLDHMDETSLPIIMRNTQAILMGPRPVMEFARNAGIDQSRVREIELNQKYEYFGTIIGAAYADHGELAPDAIGLFFEIGSIRVYFAGDTAYRPEMMKVAMNFKPHIAILPINGAYGNLNGTEAAQLSRDLNAKITIPCHYWTFKEHGGDPAGFDSAMKSLAPDSAARFMTQGETALFEIRR